MFTSIGRDVFRFIDALGKYCLFVWDIFRHIFSRQLKGRRVFEQMYRIGTMSLPITGVTLLFVGMVFTNQVAKEFTKIGAGKIIGAIVGFAVWRELGPLFAGVVVAARVGAAISTEIGAMKVTEQIDALRAMAISPFTYLYVPRMLALITMVPILVIFADAIGFLSGLGIYMLLYHGNPMAYLTSASQMLTPIDILAGVFYKGPIFGFIIASLATFIGSSTGQGAVGIGKSATQTVVAILVTIFVANFFLSFLIF